MNQAIPQSPTAPSPTRPFLPILLLLFAGSGCSALIYEIVWFQLLQLVIGSSAVSLGVLLGTFMGGMCIGSIALSRFLSARHHPLRVYAFLELAIGVVGILVLFGMPAIDSLYSSVGGHGFVAIVFRGIVSGLCLLPPTILMGATLPAIARWSEATPHGVSWLGFFYSGNIAGATFGVLLAGFYLLRLHDMETATYVAAGVNLTVAAISFGLAKWTTYEAPKVQAVERMRSEGNVWAVYVAIALSGAGALAAEVIWTRLLSLLLGATVYTFSIILAVFLVGLGIGSTVGAFLARTSTRPRVALGCCQLLLGFAIAWTSLMLAKSLPFWPINPYISKSPWFNFQLDLARCLWTLLPATCLWGASFPLALAAASVRGQDPGRLVGRVYAANTIGAIVGALSASLILINWLGTQHAQRVLIGLSALAAVLMLEPYLWQFGRTKSVNRDSNRPMHWGGIAAIAVTIALPVLLAWSVSAIPWQLVAYGRALPIRTFGTNLFVGEGMNSSVAVTEFGNPDDPTQANNLWTRYFHVSGKVEASTEPADMRLQRMLGHLPALVHPHPRSVLIVGCGAGVTAGTFVIHPEVERIVICEIEPLVPRVVAKFFANENHHVVDDPRVEIIHDDARHFILTTREKFDIITSDPIHPWVKGSATLYSKEYFELCKAHLNPGGVITQWVPLYETTREVVKSEFATFFDVFPHGTIWNNPQDAVGYDVVLLGQVEPTRIDMDEIETRMERHDHDLVAKALRDVGFSGPLALFATYAGRASDLKPWLVDAQINRDRNLRLQYLAGMNVDKDEQFLINSEMMSYRKFPEDLFIGTGNSSAALRFALKGVDN
jgi:spermidine synthase